jgi:hypothetical protein
MRCSGVSRQNRTALNACGEPVALIFLIQPFHDRCAIRGSATCRRAKPGDSPVYNGRIGSTCSKPLNSRRSQLAVSQFRSPFSSLASRFLPFPPLFPLCAAQTQVKLAARAARSQFWQTADLPARIQVAVPGHDAEDEFAARDLEDAIKRIAPQSPTNPTRRAAALSRHASAHRLRGSKALLARATSPSIP